MPRASTPTQLSALELAWLATLADADAHAHAAPWPCPDPELSKAERLLRRKARNRTSAGNARERQRSHVRSLEARVRELERENADLLAQVQLETAQNAELQNAACGGLILEP